MSTSRPFAYNIGLPISGTEQIGDLAIGTPDVGFVSTGIDWWNGPDEELGYIIAVPVPLNNQDTPVQEDSLYLDPNFKATDISLSNNDQTATQVFSYQQSVLGQTLIAGSEKVMFSVKFTSTNPTVGVGGRVIGVGRPSMNYNSTTGAYPGNDTESIGFSDDGKFYFNGTSTTGYPTWTSGDIIDIAISHDSLYWWIRVNGGDWNNNPLANPTTDTGGVYTNISDFYPVLCPYIYGTMKILNVPTYGCPLNYNFLGHHTASVGFLRSSVLTEQSFVDLVNSRFNQNFTTGDDAKTWLNGSGYWTSWGAVSFTISTADISNLLGSNPGVTTNGLLGFITAGGDNIVNQIINYQLTPTKLSEITNLFIANGVGINNEGYIFNVTWGAGSSITNGIARIGVNSSQFLIGVVDTAYNDWYTNNAPGGPVNPSLAGTFNFPATFTLYTPLIQSESNYWC
jgi:hypothetical protein